jgi:hypothetical protein
MTYKLMYFNTKFKEWRQSLFGAVNFDLEDGFSSKLLAEAYLDKAKQYRNLEYKVVEVK